MSLKTLIILLIAICAPLARSSELLSGQWHLQRPQPADATLTSAPAPDAPAQAKNVLHVEVARAVQPFYEIMLMQTIAPAIPQDHRLQLSFWARSATRNPMRAMLEKVGAPYTAAIELSLTLTPEWKHYTATGNAPGYGPNGLGVRLQLGYQPGAIELAGVSLLDQGPDPDIVSAQQAITPAAIQKRIQTSRMGNFVIQVRDARHQPLPAATVRVEQKRHAFLFGCNIFELQPTQNTPWQKAYQERFTALFNYATLPFYWGTFEREQGKPQYEKLQAMAQWCVDHHLTPKGHPLVWHEVYPRWAPRDPDVAIPLLRQRTFDLIGRYENLIHYWDVLNEANAATRALDTGEGAWIKRDGPAAAVSTALGWAREAAKNKPAVLLYNDFDIGAANVRLLEQLKAKNSLPDAIGLQSHMHNRPWPMQEVWRVCERFAKFGKPLHFTEITVLSGPSRNHVDDHHPPTDWVTTPEKEAEQADYVEQFYTLLFSHPSMAAITWWDFSDDHAWKNAPAGLTRKDLSPKPAYDRLLKLIRHQWWTDTTGKTDPAGTYQTPAFYGDYLITITDPQGHSTTHPVTLTTAKTPVTITLSP